MAGDERPRPARRDLPAKNVRDFRSALQLALTAPADNGQPVGQAKWGVYAFYDYDGEPIYVGQTKEGLSIRVRRHLTNQRTDAVAMRILDTFEVAEVELWPLWELDALARNDRRQAQQTLDATEYTAYLSAIEQSRFRAILNEKIPPVSPPVELPPSYRFGLIDAATREERGHPDVRIARRAETIARLAAVAHERGEVSVGLRRVLVIQAVRLAHLSATRLAFADGRDEPSPDAIATDRLIGSVLVESDEPE
ncbi:MAG: GIY-YIG nuclease family protein [Aeromicrobium sp.]|uniref:GIY-YIG nuclease family protein n=1 Tax=Aeromicrobium sp. TaxID=1871063 RepID=UPI0039E678CB